MRNRIYSVMCAAVFFSATIGIAAQQPPSGAPPTPSQPPSTAQPPPSTAPPTATQPPASTRSDAANKITVTGCLQAAPAEPTGTAGATDANGDSAGKFVLTGAAAAPAADAASAPARGASAARTYRLVANDAALTPHLGKKLEVTGTLDDKAGATRGATSPASPDSSASVANAPKLTVESGKIISPSCME